jgi:hypothetical protein
VISRDWFHVAVVARRVGALTTERLVEAVGGQLPDRPDLPSGVTGPEPAWSFDGPPPEGEAGAAVWVRGESIGAAVDAATTIVLAQAERLAGAPVGLWDVRAVPLSAVLRNPSEGSVARLEAEGGPGALDS